jgi:hypothetical protein
LGIKCSKDGECDLIAVSEEDHLLRSKVFSAAN